MANTNDIIEGNKNASSGGSIADAMPWYKDEEFWATLPIILGAGQPGGELLQGIGQYALGRIEKGKRRKQIKEAETQFPELSASEAELMQDTPKEFSQALQDARQRKAVSEYAKSHKLDIPPELLSGMTADQVVKLATPQAPKPIAVKTPHGGEKFEIWNPDTKTYDPGSTLGLPDTSEAAIRLYDREQAGIEARQEKRDERLLKRQTLLEGMRESHSDQRSAERFTQQQELENQKQSGRIALGGKKAEWTAGLDKQRGATRQRLVQMKFEEDRLKSALAFANKEKLGDEAAEAKDRLATHQAELRSELQLERDRQLHEYRTELETIREQRRVALEEMRQSGRMALGSQRGEQGVDLEKRREAARTKLTEMGFKERELRDQLAQANRDKLQDKAIDARKQLADLATQRETALQELRQGGAGTLESQRARDRLKQLDVLNEQAKARYRDAAKVKLDNQKDLIRFRQEVMEGGGRNDRRVGQISNAEYVDRYGRPADPAWRESDAIKAGFSAHAKKDMADLRKTQQALNMLGNTADVFENLAAHGKMITASGSPRAIVQRGKILFQQHIMSDDDLRVAAAQESQIVPLMRALGDKGVRAAIAFSGAMELLKGGVASYDAVRRYLKQVDQELRSDLPATLNHALDDSRGASQMNSKPRPMAPVPDVAAPSLSPEAQQFLNQ
jgi:hypothetical protein